MAIRSATLAFPAGLNNRAQETNLPKGSARIAHNGVLDREGVFHVRPGYRVVSAGVAHSLYVHPDMPFALFALGGNLVRTDGASTTTITALSGSDPVSYAFVGDRVLYSNGQSFGCVFQDGTHRAYPLPPTPNPLAIATSTGGLPEGTYQVAVAPIMSWGELGGLSWPVAVAVTEGGGISVAVPAPPSGASSIRLYVSQTGEDILYAVADLLSANSSYPVGIDQLGQGQPVLPRPTDPMPALPMIAYCRRRLFGAIGPYVLYSQPLQYSQTVAGEHIIKLGQQGDVVFLDSVSDGRAGDGVYIGTRTGLYWLAYADPENPTDMPLQRVGRGVLRGACSYIPGHILLPDGVSPSRRVPAWVSADGTLCIGRPGGNVQEVGKSRVAIPAAAFTHISYAQVQGQETLALQLTSPGLTHPLAATDTAVATRNTYSVTHP